MRRPRPAIGMKIVTQSAVFLGDKIMVGIVDDIAVKPRAKCQVKRLGLPAIFQPVANWAAGGPTQHRTRGKHSLLVFDQAGGACKQQQHFILGLVPMPKA